MATVPPPTISSVACTSSIGDLSNTTVMITVPPPWVVTGTALFNGPATALAAMAYQVNDNSAVGFNPPDPTAYPAGTPGPYTFSLTSDDLPGNGQYLLTIYAWDNDNPQGTNSTCLTVQLQLVVPVLGPPTGCCTT